MRQYDRFLRPRSIVVVGGDPAERVIRELDRFEFEGEVWPVHPSRDMMGGRPCLRSVDELPGSPDVGFVAVPRHAAPSIVRALRERRCGGAVVYSSGFAEAGDGELQVDLIEAANPMPLLGPNCYGYVNALDGTAVWPDVHGLRRVARGAAIITQSGNIAINMTMARRALDIGIVITAGNQADLDLQTLIEVLSGDPRISAVGIQFEGATDGVGLGRAMLAAARRGVPVVALKMGTSPLGAAVSASHTGAIAGEDDAWDALFRRYGVARAHTIPAFLEALKLAPVVRGPARLLSLSASGGEAAHVADLAHRAGVDLPELEPDHAAAVRATVDALVTVSNPMDYHTFSWGDEARQRRTFHAAVSGPFDVAMLVLDFPVADMPEAWWAACRAFAAAVDDMPGLVVATLPETMPEAVQERIRELGLIPMLGVAETIAAIAALRHQIDVGSVALHREPRRRLAGPVTLDEADSKAMLTKVGVPVPAGTVTREPLAAPVTYPVTVKVLGLDHKAVAGAVAVGVADGAELERALAGMPPAAAYLLEDTVQGGVAELLVSLRSEPAVGWMLTVGAGGTLVEAFDDHAHLLVPATAAEVRAAMWSLRIGPALAGADVVAAADSAVALQSLISADERVVEAEINPLILLEDGAVAVDAMVTVAGA